MRKWIQLIACIGQFAVLATPASAQDYRARVQGSVLDQSKAISRFGIERCSVGEFDTFQQTLQDITDLSGVTFDAALHAVDAMIGSPDESRRRPLRSANEVRSRRTVGV